MYLFKTSAETLPSVVGNNRHAFLVEPKGWETGERVLLSKNRADCKPGEKQIQYITKLKNIRPALPGEIEKYWHGHEGQWKFIVEFVETSQLMRPFNLDDILGSDAEIYHPVVTFKRLEDLHENLVRAYVHQTQPGLLNG